MGKLGGPVLRALGLPVLRLVGGLEDGVLTDGGMSVLVDLLDVLRANTVSEVGGELLLEALIIFLLEGLHVLSDVSTVDVLLEGLVVELLGFRVVAGESLIGVGDEDSTIAGTLEGTEETGAGGGPLETDVEVGLEGTGSILLIESLGEGEGAIGLGNTLVLVGKAELGKGAASGKETSCVGCIRYSLDECMIACIGFNAPAAQLVKPCLMP